MYSFLLSYVLFFIPPPAQEKLQTYNYSFSKVYGETCITDGAHYYYCAHFLRMPSRARRILVQRARPRRFLGHVVLKRGVATGSLQIKQRMSISGHFCSHTFQSYERLPHALGFILGAACGSVVLLLAARVFDYFVVPEIAFMDNQAQITETTSRLDSEKVSS